VSNTVGIEYLFTVNTELVESDLRKIETMLVGIAGKIRRLTGNESLDGLMAKIQETINYVRALQVAVAAFQAALIPGAGWVKAAWVGFAAVNAAFAGYDMVRGY